MREAAKRRWAMDGMGGSLALGILALALSPLGCHGTQQGDHGRTIVPTTRQAKAQAETEIATSATPATLATLATPATPATATSAAPAPRGTSQRRPQGLERVSSGSDVPRISNQVEQPDSAQARMWAAQLEAIQREQDERLLQRQQADSQRQQQEQERTVRQWAKTIEAQQEEPRIQDAPGPAQTGLLPGVPPAPSQSNEDEQRIQDAPGPAQTIPAPEPPPQPQPEPEPQPEPQPPPQ